MEARLFCKTGPFAGVSRIVEREATIGKNPGNTIQLPPDIISGKHARIYFDQQRNAFFIEDLKSLNGTWVDGVRVRDKERLDRIHVITFARSFDFIFQVVSESSMSERKQDVVTPQPAKLQPPTPRPNPQGGTELDQAVLVPPVIGPQAQPERKKKILPKTYILQVKMPQEGTLSFGLREGGNLIGRESSCAIRINHPSVSRKHAVLTVMFGLVTLRDLGSSNKTFLGGKEITTEVTIGVGAEVKFGSIEARLSEES